MGPEHVAHTMRASYGLAHVTPDLVLAWERGALAPRNTELTALAGVLWCSPGELAGRPRTLREYRLARGLAPEDVAQAVDLELHAYLRMEETGDWHGTERQSTLLARVLGLSLPDLVTVTGRDERLAELLRAAVTSRWQAYVRPVSRTVPLQRRVVEHALEELHLDYRGQLTDSPGWTDGFETAGPEEFLHRIVEHFWATVREIGTEPR